MGFDLQDVLAKFPARRPPQSLLRFYSTNPKGLRALTHGTLKLTPPNGPDGLNDPFEMWAGVSVEGLTQEAVLKSVTSREGLFHTALSEMARNRGLTSAVALKLIVHDIKHNQENWFKHLESMNESLRRTIGQHFGICSFSAFSKKQFEGPPGIRHWAMYAESHKGFAIEYDGRQPFFRTVATSRLLFPVEYRSLRLRSNLSDFDVWSESSMVRTMRLWSAMKCAQAWGHEKEWRLVLPIGDGTPNRVVHHERTPKGPRSFAHLWRWHGSPEKRSVEAQAIRRVILGERAPSNLIEAVRKALTKPHYSHVQLLKARCCKRDFALIYEPI